MNFLSWIVVLVLATPISAYIIYLSRGNKRILNALIKSGEVSSNAAVFSLVKSQSVFQAVKKPEKIAVFDDSGMRILDSDRHELSRIPRSDIASVSVTWTFPTEVIVASKKGSAQSLYVEVCITPVPRGLLLESEHELTRFAVLVSAHLVPSDAAQNSLAFQNVLYVLKKANYEVITIGMPDPEEQPEI